MGGLPLFRRCTAKKQVEASKPRFLFVGCFPYPIKKIRV